MYVCMYYVCVYMYYVLCMYVYVYICVSVLQFNNCLAVLTTETLCY
jgi:hypothetical protein